MSTADSSVIESDSTVPLTANQIAAGNPSEAQMAARFQPGVSGNLNGRPKGTLGAKKLFEIKMLEIRENEKTRLDEAVEFFANAVAKGDPLMFGKWLDREWPTVNKLQAEVLTHEVRNDLPLVPSDSERDLEIARMVASASKVVIDVGEE